MHEVKLGQLASESDQRDAIHVAIAPVVAGEALRPGQPIGFADGYSGSDRETVCGGSTQVGIVDPFLKANVFKGQRFYMLLFPGTITSLRHEWSHPAFANTLPSEGISDRAFSERWLREYAAKMNCYDEPAVAFADLLAGLQTNDLHFHGTDLYGLSDLENHDELKRHAEQYLGITIDWERFAFSCGC